MLPARIDPPRSLPLPPFHAWAYARPHGETDASGDRLAVEVTEAGLTFMVADAAGHGARGQRFWDAAGTSLEARWRALLATPCELLQLEAFARELNDDLHREGAHLALAVGALGPEGRLRVAVCGYGVHVLPAGPAGASRTTDSTPLFGLKLGWLSTTEWEDAPRAFVGRELRDITQVTVLTDGFLGEDHRDAEQTLRFVKALGDTCAGLDVRSAVDHVRALPHVDDDATVLTFAPPDAE